MMTQSSAMTLRSLITTLALAVIASSLPTLAAAQIPDRPIRIFIPYVPGGPADVITRSLTQRITSAGGPTFVVENKTGGGGVIAAQAAKQSSPDGTTLFKQQCATCHTTNLSDPVRQGPSLFKIVGRPAGKADGFHYSAGFAKADFVWDDTRLDAYLANPQAMVPGSIMAYRQPKPETRAAIIAYLKELN